MVGGGAGGEEGLRWREGKRDDKLRERGKDEGEWKRVEGGEGKWGKGDGEEVGKGLGVGMVKRESWRGGEHRFGFAPEEFTSKSVRWDSAIRCHLKSTHSGGTW